MTSLTLEQKKELNTIFKKLEIHELRHVYNILVTSNIKFTKTSCSILLKDTDISDDVMKDIYNYAVTRYNESIKYRQLDD